MGSGRRAAPVHVARPVDASGTPKRESVEQMLKLSNYIQPKTPGRDPSASPSPPMVARGASESESGNKELTQTGSIFSTKQAAIIRSEFSLPCTWRFCDPALVGMAQGGDPIKGCFGWTPVHGKVGIMPPLCRPGRGKEPDHRHAVHRYGVPLFLSQASDRLQMCHSLMPPVPRSRIFHEGHCIRYSTRGGVAYG